MKDVRLDAKDLKIIELLQKNGRITNVALAEHVGLSPPTVLERVRKLEASGVISGYTAMVNAGKLGLTLVAFVLVTLTRHTKKTIDRFRKGILEIPEVLECYQLGGEEDFLLKVVERDIAAYRDFLVERLTAMEEVKHVRTMIVFDTLKRNVAVPVPDILKE
ncbi:MAG: Lrp/AsnC family transcriptional regulator [Deltaproteobacteria bacterium]|nr:MAG: Lrp/AsnC family transcriptional regulator [Deltaproteobacteria bacterium]